MLQTAKNPKTNSKEVKDKIQSYILNAIDTDEYLPKDATLQDKLTFICIEFNRVACHAANIKFHKTYQNAFIEWFQGMPSYFEIEVYNYEIMALMASFGLPLPSNKTESEGIELFNYLIYSNFVNLCKKNKVDFWQYCHTK